MFDGQCDQRMAGLMICDAFFVAGSHDAVLLLETEHDAIDGFFQIAHFDLIAAAADGQKRGFIDNIGEIRADHARRPRAMTLSRHPATT